MQGGDNFFFKQNNEDTKRLAELADMKELNLEGSIDEARNVSGLNIDLPALSNSPLHLPAIAAAEPAGGKS